MALALGINCPTIGPWLSGVKPGNFCADIYGGRNFISDGLGMFPTCTFVSNVLLTDNMSWELDFSARCLGLEGLVIDTELSVQVVAVADIGVNAVVTVVVVDDTDVEKTENGTNVSSIFSLSIKFGSEEDCSGSSSDTESICYKQDKMIKYKHYHIYWHHFLEGAKWNTHTHRVC